MFDDYSNCAMDAVKFKKVREKCKDLLVGGFSRTKICAYVYDLFQKYMISEGQEDELYRLTDPNGEADDTYLNYYYEEMIERNPLLEIA